jgi:hypothetical protein
MKIRTEGWLRAFGKCRGCLWGGTIPLVILVLLFLVGTSAGANYIWEPQHQITYAETSAVIDDITPGRVTGEKFHFTIQNEGEVINTQGHYGALLSWESSDNWNDLWSDRIAFFEEDHPTWDQHVTVDRNGNVHLIYEAFDYYPPALQPIGFKSRGAANWPQGTPIFVTGDSTDIGSMFPCATTSPHFFIQERAAGDTLHMTYQQDFDCVQSGDSLTDWMGYRRTPLDAEDLDDPDLWRWERITWVTERFKNQSYTKNPNGFVFVDVQDSVHFFGEEQICNTFPTPDSLRFLHLWGRPPAAGQDSGAVYWSNLHADTLDYYPSTTGCGQEPPISSEEAGSGEFSAVQDSNAIYLSWNRILNATTKAREIALTRINTGANGDPPDSAIVLTGDDGLLIGGGSYLTRTADGAFHLTYRGASAAGDQYFDNYHMWTTGNPMVRANWSAPTKITVDRLNNETSRTSTPLTIPRGSYIR